MLSTLNDGDDVLYTVSYGRTRWIWRPKWSRI